MKYILKDGREIETKQQIVYQLVKKDDIDKGRLIYEFLKNNEPTMFLVEFEHLPLKEWQVAEITQEYKRADGQYVYEGNFCSREFIEEQIKEQYIMIVATINYY